jgi:hypothetical protein
MVVALFAPPFEAWIRWVAPFYALTITFRKPNCAHLASDSVVDQAPPASFFLLFAHMLRSSFFGLKKEKTFESASSYLFLPGCYVVHRAGPSFVISNRRKPKIAMVYPMNMARPK